MPTVKKTIELDQDAINRPRSPGEPSTSSISASLAPPPPATPSFRVSTTALG